MELESYLKEGDSSLTNIFRSATGERGLTAVRSRSRENNTQLFSNTHAPLRYLKSELACERVSADCSVVARRLRA